VPTYPYSPYYYAAYGIAALIYLGYAASLYRRIRALRDRTPPR
jgi:hypothetical protein